MNDSNSAQQEGPEGPEAADQESRAAAPEGGLPEGETNSALGKRQMRRATSGRRRWFGADETQSLAFYGEYYR